VRQLIGWHRDLPQQEERARLLREVRDIFNTTKVFGQLSAISCCVCLHYDAHCCW
jgi:hypothetical protein